MQSRYISITAGGSVAVVRFNTASGGGESLCVGCVVYVVCDV